MTSSNSLTVLCALSDKLLDLSMVPNLDNEFIGTLDKTIQAVAVVIKESSTNQLQGIQKALENIKAKLQAAKVPVDCFEEISSACSSITDVAKSVLSPGISSKSPPSLHHSPRSMSLTQLPAAGQLLRLINDSPSAGAQEEDSDDEDDMSMLNLNPVAGDGEDDDSENGSRASVPCVSPCLDGPQNGASVSTDDPEALCVIDHLALAANAQLLNPTTLVLEHSSAAASAAVVQVVPVQPSLDELRKLKDKICNALLQFSMDLANQQCPADELSTAFNLWNTFLREQYDSAVSWLRGAADSGSHKEADKKQASASVEELKGQILVDCKKRLGEIQIQIDQFKVLAAKLPAASIKGIVEQLLDSLNDVMPSDDDSSESDGLLVEVQQVDQPRKFSDDEYCACLAGISNFDPDLINAFIQNVLIQRFTEMQMPAFVQKWVEKFEFGKQKQIVFLSECDSLVEDAKKNFPDSLKSFSDKVKEQEGILHALAVQLLEEYNEFFNILSDKPNPELAYSFKAKAFLVSEIAACTVKIEALMNELEGLKGFIAKKDSQGLVHELSWDQMDLFFKMAPTITAPTVPPPPLNEEAQKLLAAYSGKLDAQLKKIQDVHVKFNKAAALLPESVSQIIYLNIARDFAEQALVAMTP